MPEANKVRLMVDSGSYSVWVKVDENGNQVESLTIEDYVAYIKKYRKYIDMYVVMDHIPGRPGQWATAEEYEEGARKTYDNYRYMRDEGLEPIPIFRQGEQFKWLETYLEKEKVDYVGLSCEKMIDARTRRVRQHWLDQVFTKLTDADGVPTIKTHGFAITSIPLLFRYPFTSVDSTTWSLIASYGFILCPVYVAGKPDYSRLPIQVHLSYKHSLERVTTRHGRINSKNFAGDGKKYEHLGPMMQQCVRHFIEEECSERLADMYVDDNARRRCVITYFKKLVAGLGDVRFQHRVRI
jgi:hypothetical protein